MFSLVQVHEQLDFVEHFCLPGQVLGRDFFQQVTDTQGTVGHFGLGRKPDVFPQPDNLFILFHLLPEGLDGAVLFRQLQVGMKQKQITFALDFLELVIQLFPVVFQGVKTSEIPRKAGSDQIVGPELVFKNVQSRIAVGSLCEEAERGKLTVL